MHHFDPESFFFFQHTSADGDDLPLRKPIIKKAAARPRVMAADDTDSLGDGPPSHHIRAGAAPGGAMRRMGGAGESCGAWAAGYPQKMCGGAVGSRLWSVSLVLKHRSRSRLESSD